MWDESVIGPDLIKVEALAQAEEFWKANEVRHTKKPQAKIV